MIVKGRNRDTAWYSIVDDVSIWPLGLDQSTDRTQEWPGRKAALEKWMDPSNFDDEGKQKVSLASIMGVE